MSIFAVKIIECHDWNIIEGDTKPAYSVRYHDTLFDNKHDAETAAQFQCRRTGDPSFVTADVVELVERTAP